ncbi:OmpA family protein [Marivita hallyeonensis]|uniref:OmpA-OmpF porin, OOP family n=1 Tax=Marivita hallyeonensis TaxID=996342 RepID=A0A1M5XTZ2_9RHOB|nr:OmpA family protein [Marivita hallyeonensis]SHI02723.1 OmpA-OmpF porin, OOP family [Marivita hallyeonensis]
MRLSSVIVLFSTFAIAAVLSLAAAWFSVDAVEDTSERAVRTELDRDALTWADVDTNGLQVFLIGTAPTEAARFQALSAAGRVVDTARVIDQIDIIDTDGIAPPRFSIEMLRSDSGISLIGLLPLATDRDQLIRDISRAVPDAPVSDLLEIADYPVPEGWDDALEYSVSVLDDLERSKISVEAGRVSIKGAAESEDARRRIEADFARRAGDDVRLALEITAPRPVISPFTLRFIKDADGARFDACSAPTEDARAQILAAAGAAGIEDKIDCRLGLGTPTNEWGTATAMGIEAIAALGGGSITFADADVSLFALEGTDQNLFDQVVGTLEADLPKVFVVNATLPEPPPEQPVGIPEFTATHSPEGSVQLRGRINSEIARQTADSFARAAFGSSSVRMTARVDETLPATWSSRVLAGLEALSRLSNGAVVVTPDSLAISGNTGNQNASSEIAGLLAEKLGDAEEFEINVTYQEKLDPLLGIPTPEECEAQIVEIIGDRKITFEPGSATLDAGTRDIMDEIAELLQLCGDIPLVIAGHTDSQGREVMNLQLSQDRAQAVANALRDRRVLTSSYEVRGYGEERPIASNDTEEGREANRRIEFKLRQPEPIPEVETTLESIEQSVPTGETDGGAEGQSDEQN